MDKAEFSLRIEAARGRLERIARSMVREGDCEDAVQSAILSAWAHLPQLRDEQAFDAWLVQILINRCRQIQRGYKRDKDTCSALLDAQREAAGESMPLREAMDALGEEEKTLLRLHHEQGYTIREIAAAAGKSEDVIKMRLYRARNRLRVILISLLLLLLLASAAIGTGMLDVGWFLRNRRAEPAAVEQPIEPESVEAAYAGEMLEVLVSDAVWDKEALSLSLVYSIAGKDTQALTVHRGNIGVDGIRQDHIWTNDGIMPISQWADGKPVRVFSVDGWRLGGIYLAGREDHIPDGLGQTFLMELYLDGLGQERYEKLIDEDGRLTFEADIVLMDDAAGEILEKEKLTVSVDAPPPQTWREMYEAYHR